MNTTALIDWREYERRKRALPEMCADEYERAIAQIVRDMENRKESCQK